MRTVRALGAAVHVSTSALGLSGCGLEPFTAYVPAGEPGSIQPIEGAEGTEVGVTSKNFTEQLILGKVGVLGMEAAGFETEDLTNGLVWGGPAPVDNTYAIAVRSEYTEEHDLQTVSGIKTLPEDERTFCVESEFDSRSDGLTPLLVHYGLDRGTEVPEANIGIYDTGAIYSATDNGACNFGEVFATDGRIPALDPTLLEDDKQFFPAYNVAPVYDAELLEQFPELSSVFRPITAQLTDEVMQELNRLVDVEGRDPADVAYERMVAEGFIVEPS